MSPTRISIRLVVSVSALVVAAQLVAAQTSSPARLLVLLRDSSELAIVDPASGKVLGRVPTVKDPHEVTVTADGKIAFVGSPSEGIAVIDVAAQKELRRIDPGPKSAPHDVLVAGGKLYFTAEGYKMIGRYDPATSKMDWLLGIGQDSTHMLLFSKDLSTIFTVNRTSNSVSFIEGVKGAPPEPPSWKITSVPLPGLLPEGFDLSPDGREIWAASRGDGSVHIIDIASKKVTQSFNLGMKDANRLVFTPDGKRVLITDEIGGDLVVLDAPTRKEIKRLKMKPDAVMVVPDGSRAYVALRQDHVVAVVDIKTLEVTNRIPTGPGSGPGCMVWMEAR